jgi:hypothetical protein
MLLEHWEVTNIYCVDVARVVYETIRDEGRTDMAVSRGLHQAIKALRDGRIDATRMMGNKSTTGAGSTNPEAPEVLQKVGNGKAQQDGRPTYEVMRLKMWAAGIVGTRSIKRQLVKMREV